MGGCCTAQNLLDKAEMGLVCAAEQKFVLIPWVAAVKMLGLFFALV